MSRQSHRLPAGGRIDRDRAISFTFNGDRYSGHPGDTVASALLANGVHMVGRGFKYHRPRGIVSAGAEEPNALLQLGEGARGEPNIRATQAELHDGLVAASVNCWPSLNLDLGEVNSLASRVIPAGFYYKTFMWPKSFWKRYEHFIRKAAGLGRAPTGADPDTYDKMHLHADVLVIGGGPAGLSAALAAGRTGARVVLADEQMELGGALLGRAEQIDGAPSQDWVVAAVVELEAMEEVRLLRRTTAFGYYDHNYVAMVERVGDHLGGELPAGSVRQRVWTVRAKQVVLATGAHERPLVFADNDRPGIMLAGAAAAYVNRFGVAPGRKGVLFINNDDAYAAAMSLHENGVSLAAVVDLREDPSGDLPRMLAGRGVEIIDGHAIVATHGKRRVKAVEVMALEPSGEAVTGPSRRIACDFVAMSGGWNPAVHLFSQSRGTLAFDEGFGCFVPGRSVQAERSAGAANGRFELGDCLSEGWTAGAAAAADAGFEAKGKAPRAPVVEAHEVGPMRPFWLVPGKVPVGHGPKHFVDFQNDVTAADIGLAHREGFGNIEHFKRYTTTGMGTDQGKTSNVNGLAILSRLRGTDIPAVGTTTFRPPYTPVTFGALAGRDVGPVLSDPVRMTPLHQWHQSNGAAFEDVGQWKRSWYYPRAGDKDMHDAVERECLAVRNGVGIMDASTLGKIDVNGPDAAEFLNRVYTNGWKKLEIGRCRYGLMLGDDGMVMDDGVTTRLGFNNYLMTTTSGGAARVLSWLEEWLQTEWPDLKVYLNSVTEHWGTISIAGPKARELLGELTSDMDLDATGFPFMSVRSGHVAGVPARVFRVSFTGEVSFEINVPSTYTRAVWSACMTAGEKFGITPFGTEAMHVLRAEKGYIVVGHDTDGTVTPGDLGMDWIVNMKKGDFIGRRSLARADLVREDRKQLVGLLTENPDDVLPEGGQVVDDVKAAPPMAMIGHVTSSYRSPILGRSIAMALIRGGRARMGEKAHIPLPDRTVTAEICGTVFYDPEGEKLRG